MNTILRGTAATIATLLAVAIAGPAAADREQIPPRDTFLCPINQPCPPPPCEWRRDCNTPDTNTTPVKRAPVCGWRRAVCHDRNLKAQRQITKLNVGS